MSEKEKISIPRRRLVIGGLAALGVGVMGAYTLQTLGFMYRRPHNKQYDDLLSLIWNRENAERIGVIVLDEDGQFEPWTVAPQLRRRIGKRKLPEVILEDAKQGRLVEARGWVIPETLALLSALSAVIR
ncbi:MAG: hypothetical protein HY243_11300 [Proteobacteria bacterium]|nr:hypothetical protein [Pseudomonadota bacterium]